MHLRAAQKWIQKDTRNWSENLRGIISVCIVTYNPTKNSLAYFDVIVKIEQNNTTCCTTSQNSKQYLTAQIVISIQT